ncbi:hypothetical protein Tco_1040904, partial [Tanacetum coccineum]
SNEKKWEVFACGLYPEQEKREFKHNKDWDEDDNWWMSAETTASEIESAYYGQTEKVEIKSRNLVTANEVWDEYDDWWISKLRHYDAVELHCDAADYMM